MFAFVSSFFLCSREFTESMSVTNSSRVFFSLLSLERKECQIHMLELGNGEMQYMLLLLSKIILIHSWSAFYFLYLYISDNSISYKSSISVQLNVFLSHFTYARIQSKWRKVPVKKEEIFVILFLKWSALTFRFQHLMFLLTIQSLESNLTMLCLNAIIYNDILMLEL